MPKHSLILIEGKPAFHPIAVPPGSPAARTLAPGRSQVNLLATRKREHSRKPDELYEIIEACSPGPRLELFARGERPGWTCWGNQATPDYETTWDTYAHNSATDDSAADRPRLSARPRKRQLVLTD